MSNIYQSSLEYYVYAYLREDGTPYYIGKGRDDRVYAKHCINLPEDRTKIIFLEKNLTEVGALALERRYIEWYGRKDLGTGILRNLTDGGEGASGRITIFTSEHKAKISAAQKGKKLTLEHKAKIGISMKGKKLPPKTLEHRIKLSESMKGSTPWNKGKKGKTPWNKGKKLGPLTIEHKTKVSATLQGKKQSTDHVAKRVAANREYHKNKSIPNEIMRKI